jgi:hypothetical protein
LAGLTITALARMLPWSWAEQERRLGLHCAHVPHAGNSFEVDSPFNGGCMC